MVGLVQVRGRLGPEPRHEPHVLDGDTGVHGDAGEERDLGGTERTPTVPAPDDEEDVAAGRHRERRRQHLAHPAIALVVGAQLELEERRMVGVERLDDVEVGTLGEPGVTCSPSNSIVLTVPSSTEIGQGRVALENLLGAPEDGAGGIAIEDGEAQPGGELVEHHHPAVAEPQRRVDGVGGGDEGGETDAESHAGVAARGGRKADGVAHADQHEHHRDAEARPIGGGVQKLLHVPDIGRSRHDLCEFRSSTRMGSVRPPRPWVSSPGRSTRPPNRTRSRGTGTPPAGRG